MSQLSLQSFVYITRLIHITRLKRNVQYCVAVSTDWPDVSLYYGSDGVLDSVECGEVTFNFDNESTLDAEFLFTLPD